MMLKSLMICEQTKLRIIRRDSLWGAAVMIGGALIFSLAGIALRRDLIAQQARIDAEAGVLRICLWIRCEYRGMNRAQLSARGFEVRARRQASKDLRHPMFAPGLHGRG
jgi:hypothetical protein